MGGRRPPFKTAHVADSQRSSDPLLFTLALALIANGDGRSANLPVVGGLLVIIRESRRSVLRSTYLQWQLSALGDEKEMTNLLKLPTWADDEQVFAVVETPRGSTCKLDFDANLRAFTLTKPLMTGLTYPYDWGFIPSTEAEDGDPLDVLIIHDSQTYPGVILRCRPVGILEVEQKKKGKTERNDRIFAVPDRSPLETNLQDIRRLPSRAHDELEQFFRATNALEEKELKFLGWHGPARAIKAIRRLSHK